MSYIATAFSISFDELLSVRGSRDQQLLSDLTREYPDYDDYDYEEDEDRSPRLSEAFASIVNGTPIEDGFWATYAEACGVIYSRLGTQLDSNPVSPASPAHLEACRAALSAINLEEHFPIFNFGRIPPLLYEPTEPFPVLSHMTPEEVIAARGLLKSVDLSSFPHSVQETLRMIDAWVEHAAGKAHGLVCVYG